MKDQFFAAANTGRGFESDFPEIFSPEKFKRIYIIKGGPGTGKSTFMKKLGVEAERRGLSPEYYFCSSDVASLDGVVIPEKRAAVLDGDDASELVVEVGHARSVSVNLFRETPRRFVIDVFEVNRALAV